MVQRQLNWTRVIACSCRNTFSPTPVIGKGLRMVGMMDRVEIWSTDTHVKMLREKVDLTALAEDVMGSLGNADEE